MQKTFIPAILASTLALGGCAQLGDLGGLGGILGGDDRGDNYGYGYQNNSEFERAAVQACGREAERYGRVNITYAEQRSRGTYTVQGRIDNRDQRRDQFTCEFRDDGRIVDFKLG
ncbi:hypothetical protein [Paraurantiacibacter namhicola]|uniref:Lipoprotein n=1 Tax=Paraurantiacibacter namhicola TaxID=645517 RepID=A0A1C7D4U8_9SPHN|nr:hypothetical protein [Paraurantiacibacter namhicola]ANU06498.1 hypothetical protein A6F65_00171 [Paraurantiacibacter namhicola]